jgi:hypothetical protein
MIYTPRGMIDAIRNPMNPAAVVRNPCVCTKIDYKGFEISVSMDSSHGDGDLFRCDIRVFSLDHGKDVTSLFLQKDESMLYGDGATLHRVMNQITEMVPA